MTEDGILTILKFYGFIAGGVVAIFRFFTYLEKKASENSLGQTRIKQLEECDRKIQEDFKELQHKNQTLSEGLEKVMRDYRDLMDHIWRFMGK